MDGDGLCLLHNTRTCGKREIIARTKASGTVRVTFGFDWRSHSDNPALIWDEVEQVFSKLQGEYPRLKFSFRPLGGKDGSIYCDICRQIRSSDVVLFDVSTSNLNVVFELGLAIGAGANVFILRSNHHPRVERLSDLNGILEYRFSRRNGQMRFEADFRRSLERKLRVVAREHTARMGALV